MSGARKQTDARPTIGSLFAGIGGFDLGFERAGWRTSWQVEINPIARAVLADRFPHASRFEDVRTVGAGTLAPVDCITAGFPCTNISQMGSRRAGGQPGLRGDESGLFFEVIRILRELRPTWVVLENVAALLSSNDGKDIEQVVRSLAELGYLGFGRVLNAQFFGVPQSRRRIFLVAGLGRFPPADVLADAGTVEAISCTLPPRQQSRPADASPLNTFTASNAAARISIGCEVLVAEQGAWRQMVERDRGARLHGIPKGLDGWHWAARHASGNAVIPAVSEWIARKLAKAVQDGVPVNRLNAKIRLWPSRHSGAVPKIGFQPRFRARLGKGIVAQEVKS